LRCFCIVVAAAAVVIVVLIVVVACGAFCCFFRFALVVGLPFCVYCELTYIIIIIFFFLSFAIAF